MPCNSTNPRAVPSWCNLGAQIQLKDKCVATSPGKGSTSWFKDLVRARRAELGNHWHLKYIRESQRTHKTSPCALCHVHWSFSRVEVTKRIFWGLSIKQSWQQFINLNPSAFTRLGLWGFSSLWRCYLSPSPMPDKKCSKVTLSQSGQSSGYSHKVLLMRLTLAIINQWRNLKVTVEKSQGRSERGTARKRNTLAIHSHLQHSLLCWSSHLKRI